MLKAIKELGDRIKLFFANKIEEDNIKVKEVLEKLEKLYAPINEHLSVAKSKNNNDVTKVLEKLNKTLEEKNLEVSLEAPKIIIPEPVVKVLQNTKEIKKITDILDKFLNANLAALKDQSTSTFISNREPGEAIPVVLTDAGLKKFYNAAFRAISSEMQPPFKDPSGERRPANIDAEGNLVVSVEIADVVLNKDSDSISIWSNTAADGSGTKLQLLLDSDGHLQVDVLTMPSISVDFPDTYPLPDEQILALTPPASITGFATQATLADILEKIIAAPATEAKQDTLIALLGDPSLSPSAPDSYTPTGSTTQALASNSNRKGLIIQNISTGGQIVSLGLGASAVAGKGIVLYPGVAWNMDRFSKTTAAINVIANVTGGSISIQEFS